MHAKLYFDDVPFSIKFVINISILLWVKNVKYKYSMAINKHGCNMFFM